MFVGAGGKCRTLFRQVERQCFRSGFKRECFPRRTVHFDRDQFARSAQEGAVQLEEKAVASLGGVFRDRHEEIQVFAFPGSHLQKQSGGPSVPGRFSCGGNSRIIVADVVSEIVPGCRMKKRKSVVPGKEFELQIRTRGRIKFLSGKMERKCQDDRKKEKDAHGTFPAAVHFHDGEIFSISRKGRENP